MASTIVKKVLALTSFIGSAMPRRCLVWLVMMSMAAPEMYPTKTDRETYCRRSAILKNAPMTEMVPTMKTRSGIMAIF